MMAIAKKKSFRWMFPGVAVLALLLFLCGCTAPARGEKPYVPAGEAGGRDTSVLSGDTAGTGQGQAGGEPGKAVPVVLYFSDDRGYLVAVKKEIPRTQAIARATIEELCRGPVSGSGLNPTIPPGTRLKDINIKDGVATVDFSRELKTKHWGGSSGELLTVYSIVNTLTQFPSVQKVQLLVEGERQQSLAGHLDISRPLQRDSGLIRSR
ncbi:MAG: GerMN domain-containing protein [Thermoanaerobacteraceae bacterium]|nr:GerMN domain-containing protein [Thermoanaerobacteraceae bacterium]